ncbi:uncharacterized protein [Bemisia tabaci]|uniref:uncharacterized protein isoform X2 n=1 Tax=Bemisia tabaci TaxID=7038 RepID=UPI003B286C66
MPHPTPPLRIIAATDGASTRTMLVRMKRSPARTMSISGYLPNGGLSYASTDLMYPSYSSMGYSGGMGMWPYSSQPKVPSKDLEPPSRSDTYGPDESTLGVGESEPSWPEKDPTSPPAGSNGMTSWAPKKSKKKQWFQKISPPTTADEDAEEGYFDKNDGAAKAHASFNAWFPIMLGVLPPYGQGGGAPEGSQRGGYPSSSPSHGSPSHGSPSHGSPSHGSPSHGSPSYEPPSHGSGSHGSQGGTGSHSQSPLHRYYSTTVIANSVNNGRSGIASSTATAYGGEQSQPQSQQRYSA